ncbi:unnamed protein product [Phaeothamnion confervicola]
MSGPSARKPPMVVVRGRTKLAQARSALRVMMGWEVGSGPPEMWRHANGAAPLPDCGATVTGAVLEEPPLPPRAESPAPELRPATRGVDAAPFHEAPFHVTPLGFTAHEDAQAGWAQPALQVLAVPSVTRAVLSISPADMPAAAATAVAAARAENPTAGRPPSPPDGFAWPQGGGRPIKTAVMTVQAAAAAASRFAVSPQQAIAAAPLAERRAAVVVLPVENMLPQALLLRVTAVVHRAGASRAAADAAADAGGPCRPGAAPQQRQRMASRLSASATMVAGAAAGAAGAAAVNVGAAATPLLRKEKPKASAVKKSAPWLDALPRNGQLLLLALGIFVFFGMHNLLQESIIRREGFDFGWALGMLEMVGVTALTAVERAVIGWRGVGGGGKGSCGKHSGGGGCGPGGLGGRALPLKVYLSLVGCLLASSSLSSIALNYINYPTKVVFRSCKLLPTMAVAAAWNGHRVTPAELASAAAVCAGLVTFALADVAVSPRFEPRGIALVAASVCADAVLPNIQERVFAQGASRTEVTFYTNAFTMLAMGVGVGASGDLLAAIRFAAADAAAGGSVCWAMVAFASLAYAAVTCHMLLVERFGSVSTVLVGSTRKATTVALSFLLFRKPFTPVYALGGALMLAGVLGSALSKKRSYVWISRSDNAGGGVSGGHAGRSRRWVGQSWQQRRGRGEGAESDGEITDGGGRSDSSVGSDDSGGSGDGSDDGGDETGASPLEAGAARAASAAARRRNGAASHCRGSGGGSGSCHAGSSGNWQPAGVGGDRYGRWHGGAGLEVQPLPPAPAPSRPLAAASCVSSLPQLHFFGDVAAAGVSSDDKTSEASPHSSPASFSEAEQA